MKSKPQLDMEKIAKALGAERGGPLPAGGGHFGALQVAAEVQARFKTPSGGGRSTDPGWTDRRLVPLAEATLSRLERLAKVVSEHGGTTVSALQVAALLLERAAEEADDEKIVALAKHAS